MKLKFLGSTWEASIKSNVALAYSNVVLVMIASFAVYQGFSTKNSIDVSLMPVVVDEKMVIGVDSANEAYLKSFGLYVATLVGNITAGNAGFVTDSMSQFFDSTVYPEIRKSILATAETRAFKEAAAATTFRGMVTFYEPSTHKVFITGDRSYITTTGGNPPHTITYEMVIRIKDRRPMVYSLESYDGAAPHTEQWLIDHPQLKEEK